jgi:MoxR-like ATPase
MRIEIGYPDAEAERKLLLGQNGRDKLKQLQAVIPLEQLLAIQNEVAKIHTSPALIDYVQQLLEYTRNADLFHFGLSPRAGLGLLRAAQAWALIENRQQVLPEDVQAVLPNIMNHRLQARDAYLDRDMVNELITHVAIL